MIEITIKVRSLMQVMQVLCFAAVVVSIVTDDTSTTQRLGHWIAIIGEGFLLLAMFLVTAGWVQ